MSKSPTRPLVISFSVIMSFLGGAIKLLTLATWLHGAVACVHDQSAEEIDSYERTLWSEALDGDRLLLHTIEFYQDLNTHLDSITDRRSAKKGIHRFAVFEQKLKTLGKRIDLLPPDRRKEFDARLKGSKELRSEMLRLMASGERIGKIPDADELVRPELEKLYRVR